MKNITLSADGRLIEQAREVARQRRTTLNAEFRTWLEQFSGRGTYSERLAALKQSMRHVEAGRKFTREEMNERR